jgi:hypothetical protein
MIIRKRKAYSKNTKRIDIHSPAFYFSLTPEVDGAV